MEEKELVHKDDDPPSKKLLGHKLFLMIIEFGYALENVFVSPYFLRLGTNSYLAAWIWLFPGVLKLFLNPIRAKYIYANKQKFEIRRN